MEYRKMMLDDLRKSLDNNEITSEELFNEANTLAHSYQEEINPFVTIIDKYKKEITSINNKINTVSEQIDNIYFDKLNKVISEADYFRYTNKILKTIIHKN